MPEKAIITNLDTGGEFPVLFNPAEYTIKRKTLWAELPVLGGGSVTRFTRRATAKLRMELFIDTTEQKTDAREHVSKIESLMTPDENRGRPPLLRFIWGSASFTGFLESFSAAYTLFRSDGTPLRALLKTVFREYARAGIAATGVGRDDKTSTSAARPGESLDALAARRYGDPSAWRVIAEANDIDDPFDTQAETELSLPPPGGTPYAR